MITPEQGARGLKIVWCGILAVMVLLYVLPVKLAVDPGPAKDLVFPVALALAAGAVLVQLVLKRNLTDATLFPRLLDMGSWSLPEESKDGIRQLRVPDRGAVLIVMAHFIFHLVIWLLAVGIAGMGKVVGVLTGQPGHVHALFAVAALSLFYQRPRREALVEQVKRWRRTAEEGRG